MPLQKGDISSFPPSFYIKHPTIKSYDFPRTYGNLLFFVPRFLTDPVFYFRSTDRLIGGRSPRALLDSVKLSLYRFERKGGQTMRGGERSTNAPRQLSSSARRHVYIYIYNVVYKGHIEGRMYPTCKVVCTGKRRS